MKSKPLKHKSTNTFRFVPFSERINSIDIRHAALYHIEHAYTEQPEENDTHFSIAIRKWHVLNLTDNFKKFKKEVFGIASLPQLLHKKEHVLDTLEKYLRLEDQLCLQPLLEILVSVAKDLREDFYQYFSRFLDILIKLLETKDADRLEWTLISLAFLFKILKFHLMKDIAVVLKKIIPLLSENKPQYINNFAAESFAFVARDIRDKNKFILLVLIYLQTHSDAITGCGHLVFEILRGVNGKFHSCIETFMPLLLQQLKNDKEHKHILFQVLTQAVSDSLQTISPNEYKVFWNSVEKYIQEILGDIENDSKGLEYILRLAGQVIEHQNGKYLMNAPQFVLLLIRVICEQQSENVLEVCSQIGAVLLLASNISLSQEHAGIIVKVLLQMPFPSILINFVQNVISYSQFDMHILPHYLNFVLQSNFETEAMYTLLRICINKSPISKNGIKLFEWVKYPLDFGNGLSLFMNYFDEILSTYKIDDTIENSSRLISMLLCLPHIEKIDVDHCIKKLSSFVSKLLSALSAMDIESKLSENTSASDNFASSKTARKALFVLGHTIESVIHISNFKRLKEICDIDTLLSSLLPYAGNPNFLSALHTVDLFLTAYEHENGLTHSYLCFINCYLSNNITSPYHIVRLLTTHVYKLFENTVELKEPTQVANNTETLSVFSLCYNIESITPSIQEYRAQLNMLQKISFNTPQYEMLKSTDFHLYALNYMLGILYTNFKLLWEPVIELIAGYGNALAGNEFWAIFHKALETSFENVNKEMKALKFENEIVTTREFIINLYTDYNNIPERPDFYNYRNLMLKTMTGCIQVCDRINRDVIIIFLNFIEKEYRRNDHTNALKIDIESRAMVEVNVNNEDNTEVIMDNVDMPEEDPEIQNDSIIGKYTFKTLINIMQVLAQFKNPRALYKEEEFRNIIMEFLKHKNAGLQKYALDCVINYKNKSVIPYKNNLYNLVDEKKFKDEMTSFKITEDAQSIRPEDRNDVVPIILRILYGKMTSKIGVDKKSGGQTKRSLVMRYLAGCKENELQNFIEMAFSYFENYMTMNAKDIHNEIINNLNLKSVTSPSKLHSALNLFEVIREHFGGYMKDELLRQLFKIFYTVSSTIASVLSNSDKVHVGYVKVMKNLRQIALSSLRKLFEQFDKYTWDKDEIWVIFETLVFPMLPKLHIEGIHNPTVLLKLFGTWCENPRYYTLLITCSEKNIDVSPLPEIFKLLLCGKATPGVVNVILDMIEKLLTLQEDAEDLQLAPIESFNTLPVHVTNDAAETNKINFGSQILIPHIPSILQIIKRRVSNSAKSNTVNKRDLLILSRITELVSTPEMCDDLLGLLLPILVKKICMNMAEENMEYAVNTIINLLQHSATPEKYIKNIAILFNTVSPIEVRKLLCKLLTSVAEKAMNNKDSLTKLARIVNELNAYNKKWIEQPDFDRRLEAYKEIYELSENNDIDIDLAILITNNCFYYIRTEKDMGLRDSAGICLKRILPKLLLKYKSANDGQFFVRDTVLSLISIGIRDTKNELLRNESLTLLGELCRECPEADVVLSDLAPLTNKVDREVDFFDNICHLQMHRRVRALLKISKVFKKVSKIPTPRTITNFLLPLASMYVCDEKYTDKNTLIDACIEVIGTSCRLLPWYHYEVILKHYLNKMRYSTEYQKQLTRILIGILDAFHFDLSKVKNIELPKALTTNIDGRKPKQTVEKETPKEDGKVSQQLDVENSEENIDRDMQIEVENTENGLDVLENELKEADEEVEKDDQSSEDITNTAAFDRMTIVSPSVAKRIIKSLTTGLLPQLNRAIGKMTDHDEAHKLNRRRMGIERQEEDMLRVPIALALVKLLQRLPGDLLSHTLPGIIIKLCSFLKSPLKQVRLAARDIVKKVMITVGTQYLGMLLEHLTMLLTRGFQVHVLVATIHTVLDSLKSNFEKGEIDKTLTNILNICTNDLFGTLSEEKEVDKLHYKTPEAKPSKKSYVTLTILAQNISDGSLVNLILPFKDVLQKHHSKKTVLKVQDALAHITTGLVTNKFLEPESLFIFLHGVASESIPEFVLGAPKREITEKQKEIMLRAKPDCFLVQQAPKRNREVQAKNVKTSAKANAHVLIEFSLNILHVILKREKLPKTDCTVFMEPLVPLLVDSLKSDHVRVTTMALKCIATIWTIRLTLTSLTEAIKEIVQTLFKILHQYATFEISKQNDNYHLVRNTFKAVTVLIRNVKYHTLDVEQLKTLLLYAEEDCQKDDRQANSFSLLKAILEAKLVSPELHEVMDKIAKISILNESARTREEARLIFMSYLTNYSPTKRMERYIQFFVSQLNYELQHGRLSSLSFLTMIINKFQSAQLSRHTGHLLLSFGATMLNDPSPECRAAAASCLEAMIARCKHPDRKKLFDIILTFFQAVQPVHLELAAQLCSRFVIVEKEDFHKRLNTILPIISGKLILLTNDTGEGRFVKLVLEQDDDKTDEEKQREKDHSLIQMLNLVENITIHCPSCLTNSRYFSDIDDISTQCQILLAYPHSWVRLKSAKILQQVLSHVNSEELDTLIADRKETDRGFLYYEPEECMKSLILDLCAQYAPGVTNDMAEQVSEVMLQIIKLIYPMNAFKMKTLNENVDTEDGEGAKVNMRWIMFKLRKAINAEVVKAPTTAVIRTSVLTMWMHVISMLSTDDVNRLADVMLPPVVRELSTAESPPIVVQLAGRVGKKLRRRIGDIEYSKMAAAAQTKLNIKRAERKKLVLQEKVNNPEKAAKRKLQLKEKKKISKKIRLQTAQGKRPRAKKRKADEIDIEDELLQ